MAREAIFISYRRDDSKEDADDLYKALAARVGESHIYKDVDNIPLGEDFGAHIRGILPQCKIALIVIGPDWVNARDQDGHRRLEDPFDWVRVEVELALAAAASSGLRVVPVLINGARMPRANETPSSFHPLLVRNAAIIRAHPDFDADTNRLVTGLGLVLAPEMVHIAVGEFIMGSSDKELGRYDSESPQHRVHITAFELGKYPVTFAEWDAAAVAGATLNRPSDKGWGRDRRPVINVSWWDVQEYIAWLNSKTSGGYRLPSEAEWEYACRARTTTAYSMGTRISEGQARFNSGSTVSVGSYAPNSFGLYDMHGNVNEWCADHYHNNYDGAPIDGSTWISGDDASSRVLRGGAWDNADPKNLRCANRTAAPPYGRSAYTGFRVARTL